MANGHGGKREGAGRKPGTTTVKTREIADQATREGITPLEIMLKVMRLHYNAEKYDAAADVAARAAPYVHPRLCAIEHGGSVEVEVVVKRIGASLAEL
jgi:hypothetical protein